MVCYFILRKIKDWFLDWFFPRYCLGCTNYGSLLCDKCRDRLEFTENQLCPGCKKISPMGMVCADCVGDWNIIALVVCLKTGDLLRKIMYSYKYGGMYELDVELTRLIFDSGFRGGNFDYVTSIPLVYSRKMWRGYNQSQRIARILSASLNIEYLDLLERIGEFKPQINLDQNERKKNVSGKFRLLFDIKKLSGKRILLVDDICTTGSTLNECAYVFKKAQCKVVGLVMARGT